MFSIFRVRFSIQVGGKIYFLNTVKGKNFLIHRYKFIIIHFPNSICTSLTLPLRFLLSNTVIYATTKNPNTRPPAPQQVRVNPPPKVASIDKWSQQRHINQCLRDFMQFSTVPRRAHYLNVADVIV